MGSSGTCKILFMDDDRDIRHVIPEMLRMEGYSVETASDGAEAVALYMESLRQKEKYDVLVLDLSVKGGMGGERTLEEIRKLDPGVKAILATGFGYDPVSVEYENFGFSGVVKKPYHVEDLIELIEK